MKLPPYGKYLYQLQLSQQLPENDVYIFMGSKCWQKTEIFTICRPSTMCLPQSIDPAHYDWPVANCDILLFDTSNSPEKLIIKFALCLLSQDANIVRYISKDFSLTVFEKDFSDDKEDK